MAMLKNKFVSLALFDVRPVNERGDLDVEKISRARGILDLKGVSPEDRRRREEMVKRMRLKEKTTEGKLPSAGPDGVDKRLDGSPTLPNGSGIKQRKEKSYSGRRFSVENEALAREKILNELMEEFSNVEEFGRFLESVSPTLIGQNRKEMEPADLDDDFDKDERDSESEPEPKLEPTPEPKKESLKLNGESSAILEQYYFPEVALPEYSEPAFKLSSFKPVVRPIPARPSHSGGEQSFGRVQPIKEKTFRPGNFLKPLTGFLVAGFLVALFVPAAAWLNQGLDIKNDVLSSGSAAYQNLLNAKRSLESADFKSAEESFGLAHADFLKIHQSINQVGEVALSILEKLPGGALVSFGSHLVKVGDSLSQAGESLVSAVQLFSFENLFDSLKSAAAQNGNVLASGQAGHLTDSIALSQAAIKNALDRIATANQELGQIKTSVLPAEIQDEVFSLKEKLPLIEEMLQGMEEYSDSFLKILGQDNPRQYLLIFQNNSEARATGGFIGTYGLLTLDRGEMTSLFIDGIFNADGQLREKIIPPQPIQKISTAWSMHDANWFADWPTSAGKIAWFYEKTGGPTVDGIFSLTPTAAERLLRLTGPIAMPEYGVVLDSNNFVELVQYETEVDYDKTANQPKKILADFAPKFIEKLAELSSDGKKKAVEIIFDCLEQKHILIYFKDGSLENLAVKEGWAGELKSTDKDYLSVVSSNINGFKTDKMIEETISHQAEIQPDGGIVDTLTVVRKHQGGQTSYDWWNRVNANYLRVYLPLGSELIYALGQTKESYQPPVNYQEQGFKNDPLIDSIESKTAIDQKTGTRISAENGKTVFGNWVYVSPGETVTLTYKYKLPFKIDLTKPSDSYSLLIQKQSGSLGSKFSEQLKFPQDWEILWQYPEAGAFNYAADLETDKFLGATFKF